MKRKQSYIQLNLLNKLKFFFLTPSKNPLFIQSIFLFIQMTLFTCFVNSDYIDGKTTLQQLSSFTVITTLSITMFLKYFFNINIIRIIYQLSIIYATSIQIELLHKTIIFTMTLICILSQILSTIQFQFKTQNPYSQTLNFIKFIHYFVLSLSTILHQKCTQIFPSHYLWFNQIISLILFTTLITIKIQSISTNFITKQLFIRFYLLSIAFIIRNLMVNWVETKIAHTYQNLIIIITSQLFYELVNYRYGKFNLQTSISNSNIVYVVSLILAYKYDIHNDPHLDKQTSNFTPEQVVISKTSLKTKKLTQQQLVDQNMQSSFFLKINHKNQSYMQSKKYDIIQEILNKGDNCNDIANKAQKLLKSAIQQKTDSTFLCYFLLAQIKLWLYDNIIQSKKLIDKIKLKLPLSYLDKLCLYKFQLKIKQQIDRKYNLIYFQNFQQFFQNQQFRSLIIKNSYQYLTFWKYLNSNNYHFKKLKSILIRIIQKNIQINNILNTIKIKCRNIIILFIDYLYLVRRDVLQTWKISRNYQIYQQTNYYLQMQNKIYLRINLQQNILVFDNIGHNITKLLGYNRSSIKNSPISLIMPPIFVNAHQKIINDLMTINNSVFYALKKNIIVKHCQQYYCQAQLQLKMTMSQDSQLIMEGFMKIIHNKHYNWLNYFIVRCEEGQINQFGPLLKDIIDIGPRKQININQFFTSKSDEKEKSQNKYLYCSGQCYQYHLLRQFYTQSRTYALYVCKINQAINLQEYSPQQQYFKQQQKFPKYPIKYQDFQTNLQQYFIKKQQNVKVLLKKISIYLIIIVLLFIATFILQIILIDRIQVTKSQNDSIQNNMDDVLDFYHAVQNIGLYIDMQAVTANLGVAYNYTYYNITKLCLTAQEMNLRLSKLGEFNQKKYGSTGKVAINYPKTIQQIINDVIGSLFINLYQNDTDLFTITKSNFHNFFQNLFGSGFGDYLTSYGNLVGQINDQDQKFKLVFGSCICLLTLIIYAMVLKVDSCQRNTQYQTINLICSLNATTIMANSVTDFLIRNSVSTTEKDIQDDQIDPEIKNSNAHILNIVDNLVLGKNQGISNISARQNSVRQFMQQQILNSTQRQDQNLNHQYINPNQSINNNTLDQRQKIERDEKDRKSQLTRPIKKRFILFWSIIIIIAISITIGSLITQKSSSQIVLANSIKNLLVILDNQILFSSTVIAYFDMLAFNSTTDLFFRNLNAYQNKDSQTYFVETNYPQFANFTQMYKNFTYVDVCQFMKCNPIYKNQVDVLYYSNIYQLNNYMQNNLSPQPIINREFDIDVLLYGFYLLESTSFHLIESYLSDYAAYQYQKSTIYYIFYFCQFAALCICLTVTLFLFFCHFRNERQKCYQILDLVKKDSYNVIEQQN